MLDLPRYFSQVVLERWRKSPRAGRAMAAAVSNGEGHVYLLAPIGDLFGEGAVTPAGFVADLQAVQGCPSVTFHIASPGGDFEQSLAIANLLEDFGKTHRTTTVVESLAASGASVIAVASQRVLMASQEAEMLLHHAWTFIAGAYNAVELDEMVKARGEDLRRVDARMVGFYARQTGLPEEKLFALIADGDRHIPAEECVELGFADEVMECEPEDGGMPMRASATQRRRISLLGASAQRSSRASAVQ